MTVRVERRFVVPLSRDSVWDFLADPRNRARAISVVKSFEVRADSTIWHLELPLPGVGRTMTVRTRTVERVPPELVRFEGESTAVTVAGEHRIEEHGTETAVQNRFDVTGHLPGVETVFRRRFDTEIENLEAALSNGVRDE
jgi:carbon monoxide dehydrogenase subunit G